jgi:hypothetical protein
MHVDYSVAVAGLRSIKLTAERAHDGPVFTVGKWVKDRLPLFDLAYFWYQLMSCITRNGGFYASTSYGSRRARIRSLSACIAAGAAGRWTWWASA